MSKAVPKGDRSFDELAEHFSHKIYGKLKGKIRLAVLSRDLNDYLNNQPTPLKVLDIGAGLGQMSLFLAKKGHHCTINDISDAMLAHAKTAADEAGVADRVRFLHCPYQALPDALAGETFDLILCHAVLEWLENPEELMAFIDRHLKAGGAVSLAFYNPASFVYRNLVMGNFNHLKAPKPADHGSLTPNNPVDYETVAGWFLAYSYPILAESGIRTFYDYTTHKRGGLANDEAVIEMELLFSQKMPYRLMGRYLHILAKKPE